MGSVPKIKIDWFGLKTHAKSEKVIIVSHYSQSTDDILVIFLENYRRNC